MTSRSGSRFSSYGVGYGRPPKETHFCPGKSGNPRTSAGRQIPFRHHPQNRRAEGDRHLKRPHSARTPAGSDPHLRAAGEASRGDARALRLLLQLSERYGESAQTGADHETMAAKDFNILRRYVNILRRYVPDFYAPLSDEMDLDAKPDAGHDVSR
jgi:hypothetical protein